MNAETKALDEIRARLELANDESYNGTVARKIVAREDLPRLLAFADGVLESIRLAEAEEQNRESDGYWYLTDLLKHDVAVLRGEE